MNDKDILVDKPYIHTNTHEHTYIASKHKSNETEYETKQKNAMTSTKMSTVIYIHIKQTTMVTTTIMMMIKSRGLLPSSS